MISRHVTSSLFAYCAGELPPPATARVAKHLLRCRECRAELDAVRAGVDAMRAAAAVKAPADLWRSIEAALDAPRLPAHAWPVPRVLPARRWALRAAASLLVVAGAGSLGAYVLGARSTGWAVESTAGTPVVGVGRLVGGARGTLGVGEWLETDAQSSARISVGVLGRADIGPRSRVRLLSAGGVEHRIAMERGELKASIWAPPRLFLVETPAAQAIDLGCVYTLRLDDAGVGVLTVISGQVELAGSARRSLVTAGSAAAMQPGRGPGTPYSLHEGIAFRDALDVLDFGRSSNAPSGREDALVLVLGEATARSSLTLWHLLPRVTEAERERVYERLAALVPAPEGVTHDAVLRLDDDALSRWRRALEPTWSKERVYIWKSAWRALWAMLR